MLNKGAQIIWNTAAGVAFLTLLGIITVANGLAKGK
tara:strand:- start:1776 stop:1883 length:108 start_codon:yes stop_codon:yes gene_type:complete